MYGEEQNEKQGWKETDKKEVKSLDIFKISL